ncbi:helix-turn-helix domain-containing protein [Actinomycetospora sp. TBRC 11914]|uniref:TetR/AcrR family transcriptional regulator n=1 Tax=Actinomycetospora sp. TBRC 11914 TaxID=2729387 RepID=UPI00289E63E4|nr:helix-turn-helix domain-containing protein [Actinomycetospora sp. TBRC 11914]
MAEAQGGRRERRKAATRAAIADAALTLFLERGFDDVTVTEIAAAADVAPSTVFSHFPTKEALVFDEDTDREAALVRAVADREPGLGVVEALHRHLRAVLDERVPGDDDRLARFTALVAATPALRDHGHRMWSRHERALADALAADAGVEPDHPATRALAHLVVETHALLDLPGVDPRAALDAAFAVLAHGWDAAAPH